MEAQGVETVRAVEWTLDRGGRIVRSETSLPQPAPGEVLLASRVGAISPGTEKTLLHGNSPSVPDSAYPYQPGYLNVVEIRSAADRTLLGERGVAVLGHRDHALIPYSRFIRIPADRSDEEALIGVLSADARHAIDVAAVEVSEDCLIVGGGILGVLTAWELSLRARGAIRLVERSDPRRELLGGIRFPSEVTIDADVGRYPFHTVFECGNTASGFARAQEAARDEGKIILISDGCHESCALAPAFFAKGLRLGKTGSNPNLRSYLGEYFARHEDRSSLVDVAFREEISFTDFPQAYLHALMQPVDERRGLVTRVRY
jgi:2-desacetyl-2-hydroxyethyl bacteriochlorophyllide A dehydrogenase